MCKFLENKWCLPAILLLALILRLLPALWAASEPQRLLRPDSGGYLTPAMALVENGSYPTTRRPPGFPVFAAAVYALGGDNRMIAVTQVFISVAACWVIAMAAKLYAGKVCGNIAALFAALNMTAIANTPLLLSDTLFALFAAGQFCFFVGYCKTHRLSPLLCTVLIAAAAVLIRPINQLFIIVLITLIMLKSDIPLKKRLLHCAYSILLFLAIITPWMLRNYLAGATFDIDTNTGAMRHQNGAMLLAKVNGTDFESEKKKLLDIEKETFKSPEFGSERAQEKWRKAEFRKMVLAHPFTYFMQHFDIRILLPDAPTLLEDFGITSSDRGTMGVLKKNGLLAALKHYFGEKWLLIIPLLIPLLIPTALLYFAVLRQIIHYLCSFKKYWFELLMLLGFAEYYLFLPGSITAPRYQLPALPCLCTFAAIAAVAICRKWKKDDVNEVEDTGLDQM